MKKFFCLFFSLAGLMNRDSFSQTLPPLAQALYNEAFAHDPVRIKYATDNNAVVIPTGDGNSFFIKWFPPGSDTINTPLIVTLHGSNGFAFDEFYLWHKEAALYGCGIIALQWYRGSHATSPDDYFTDEQIYSYIDSALLAIKYPAGKAQLHGFSRGAARSYALAFNDSHGGKNYFCTVFSNSGSAMPGYPLYARINAGNFGPHVFTGKHWILFCGGFDPNPDMSGCNGMNNTKIWLEQQGAKVDLFIQDKNAGHGGFHQSSSHMEAALKIYLDCFNGKL